MRHIPPILLILSGLSLLLGFHVSAFWNVLASISIAIQLCYLRD